MNAPAIILPAIFETFTKGSATLIHGRSEEIAPQYSGEADLIFSDPPYPLTAGGRAKKGGKHKVMSGMFDPDVYDNSGKLMDLPSWDEIAEVITMLGARDCEAYVMANDKNIFAAQNAMVRHRWKFHNLLVWDKICPTPNRWYMKHLEFILYLWQGKARAISDPSCKQLMSNHAPRGGTKFHPTQKPVEIIRKYVTNSTRVGDLVMDPYAGSGSTIIAAALEGRRAIGFEKSETHFRNAARMMDQMIRD